MNFRLSKFVAPTDCRVKNKTCDCQANMFKKPLKNLKPSQGLHLNKNRFTQRWTHVKLLNLQTKALLLYMMGYYFRYSMKYIHSFLY